MVILSHGRAIRPPQSRASIGLGEQFDAVQKTAQAHKGDAETLEKKCFPWNIAHYECAALPTELLRHALNQALTALHTLSVPVFVRLYISMCHLWRTDSGTSLGAIP